jgi:putative holliday junction resolvase
VVPATTLADDGTVLGFDFGTRKIGVAVGNTRVRAAHPLTTIRGEATAARLKAVAALVEEWQPRALVVGVPVHADGTAHQVTAQAEKFAQSLESRFGLRVMRVDERFTTQIADSNLREAGLRGAARAEVRDAVAAQLILQSWLDENGGTSTRDPA